MPTNGAEKSSKYPYFQAPREEAAEQGNHTKAQKKATLRTVTIS